MLKEKRKREGKMHPSASAEIFSCSKGSLHNFSIKNRNTLLNYMLQDYIISIFKNEGKLIHAMDIHPKELVRTAAIEKKTGNKDFLEIVVGSHASQIDFDELILFQQ